MGEISICTIDTPRQTLGEEEILCSLIEVSQTAKTLAQMIHALEMQVYICVINEGSVSNDVSFIFTLTVHKQTFSSSLVSP